MLWMLFSPPHLPYACPLHLFIHPCVPHNSFSPASRLHAQSHHRDILALNEKLEAHKHYDYFRVLLADRYEVGLDAALGKLIAFLTEVTSVPVLLSMVRSHLHMASSYPCSGPFLCAVLIS